MRGRGQGGVWAWLAAVGLLLVAIAGTAEAKKAVIGKPAMPFTVTTLRKEKLDLALLRGKVVLVNVWATWCGPCRQEFVLFDGYQRLRAKNGFTVVAIESGGADSSGPMRKLAEIASFPVALSNRSRAPGYDPIDEAVPSSYLIDRAGVLRYMKRGAFTLEELDEVVRPLLNEPAPADTVASAPAAPGQF